MNVLITVDDKLCDANFSKNYARRNIVQNNIGFNTETQMINRI